MSIVSAPFESQDICPVCNLRSIHRCGCPANDAVCPNNHSWHHHQFHSTGKDRQVYHSTGTRHFSCPYYSELDTEPCHCEPVQDNTGIFIEF